MQLFTTGNNWITGVFIILCMIMISPLKVFYFIFLLANSNYVLHELSMQNIRSK